MGGEITLGLLIFIERGTITMHIPKIKGVIRRRLLVNYRASPGVVQRLLPAPFRPKRQGAYALVGICLIRLEQIRPVGSPALVGIASENAAHRIAVEWTDPAGVSQEGVYIPRRDSGSWLNRLAGGRLFPGEHHAARFTVSDQGGRIDFAMQSVDRSVAVKVVGSEADGLPAGSCFSTLSEASAFFEAGSVGYSARIDPTRSDGVALRTEGWKVRPLALTEIRSTYFEDDVKFPPGSIYFDHALIMRDIAHEWHGVDEMIHS